MTKRILVVEDQEDNRRILRDLLRHAGFEVLEVGDGEQALSATAAQHPDVILMDIQLPLLDGRADRPRRKLTGLGQSLYSLLSSFASVTISRPCHVSSPSHAERSRGFPDYALLFASPHRA
jgi:FixJ family two-component response regulator